MPLLVWLSIAIILYLYGPKVRYAGSGAYYVHYYVLNEGDRTHVSQSY